MKIIKLIHNFIDNLIKHAAMKILSFTILFVLLLVSCNEITHKVPKLDTENPLELIAETDMLWTGMAISKEGRIFVNFPRWSPNVTISVGEIINGEIIPFPNEELNSWSFENPSEEKFTCVQSVYIDDQNYLWILDPANPVFQGVVESGGKLYKIDLSSNSIIETFTYDTTVCYNNSYLNDVRIDTEKNIAYITDSGIGSIIVTDLKTGISKRLLEGHNSVNAHLDYLQFGENKIPLKVHSDGIALNNNREYLYYIPLTSHTLYRIKTEYLINNEIKDEYIEKVSDLDVATDGIMFDNFNNLFLGGLEDNSINVYTYNNELMKLIKDKRIKWADSFTRDSSGNMYFTTSQLHLPPNEKGKYSIYKINMK